MKLLFDENLPERLIGRLDDLFPGSVHARTIGLQASSDSDVWDYAIKNNFIIVSKDSDFHQRSFALGSPPKVIWLRIGNCATGQVEKFVRSSYDAIVKFDNDEQASFLVIAR